MTNKKADGEPSEDGISDDDDVTEIISADVTEIISTPAPSADEQNPDVTQILPMRSTSQPSHVPGPIQHLPGTIIGRAGAEQADTTRGEPGADADEDDATKILFAEPSDATPATTEYELSPQPEDETGQDALPTSGDINTTARSGEKSDNVDDIASVAETEPTTAQEKTVFLGPVSKTRTQDDFNPPVGWLVIVAGPGRGAVLDIHYGQNTIGRGDDHHIQLNFGDTQISRETHAFVIYDELERTFFLRDAGQKNLVRINASPVMAPTELKSHDHIQIGQTTCLFVPLCTNAFDWLGGEDDPETGPPEEGKS